MNDAEEQVVVPLINQFRETGNGFVDNKYSPLVRQNGNKQLEDSMEEDSLISKSYASKSENFLYSSSNIAPLPQFHAFCGLSCFNIHVFSHILSFCISVFL